MTISKEISLIYKHFKYNISDRGGGGGGTFLHEIKADGIKKYLNPNGSGYFNVTSSRSSISTRLFSRKL